MLQKIGKIVVSQETGDHSLNLLSGDDNWVDDTSRDDTGGDNTGGDPGVIIFNALKRDVMMLEHLWDISQSHEFAPNAAGFAQQEVIRHINEIKGLLSQVLYLTLNNQVSHQAKT
jgi:hypothetical protein